MNEVLKTIFSRAGVKEYLNREVEPEKRQMLLRAGIAAPNAYNKQLWHFTAVTNPKLLERIDRETFHCMVEKGTTDPASPYRPLHGAPMLVVISSDSTNPFSKQDCSCANQNIALAATSLGLATRYLDIPNLAFNRPEGEALKRACEVPEGYETVCFLCVGYPRDPAYAATPKREDLISIVE